MAQDKISYLALGDSYTIGEAVDSNQSWPNVLTESLAQRSVSVELEKVIAVTGWTTDELLTAIDEDQELKNSSYNLVSLLIGVNNQYRGYDIHQYEKEFEQLLEKAIQLAGKEPKNVFVVSIPDYGVTPFVKENDKDPEVIERELTKYNELARNISVKYGVRFLDITPISLKAAWDSNYVATDGLHPSAKMYNEWAEYIEPVVYQMLTK